LEAAEASAAAGGDLIRLER